MADNTDSVKFTCTCKNGHRLTLDAHDAKLRGQGVGCPTCYKPMFVDSVAGRARA